MREEIPITIGVVLIIIAVFISNYNVFPWNLLLLLIGISTIAVTKKGNSNEEKDQDKSK